MKKFVRLLSFEMNRFLKFLLPTLLITGAVQLFATISASLAYNTRLEKLVAAGQPLAQISPFSLQEVTGSGWFDWSIMLIVLVFMFYSFYTWYREWLGKNTFIYRLLMLPINRIYLFFSKALVFLIGGLLAFVFQFDLYFIELKLAEWLVLKDHYISLNIHSVQPMYSFIQDVLFPTNPIKFISIYSFAFAALVSLFAGILIERSYGWKGMFFGAAYFVGFFILYGLLNQFLYTHPFSFILRPSQNLLLLMAFQFLMFGSNTLISGWLLKDKIKI